MSSLSSLQVEAYLARISLPEVAKVSLREGPGGARALEAITMLQQHHMAAVPFENLDLHYTSKRSHPLQIESIFQSVVQRRRGGTCIQVHTLFAELLRALGFHVYFTGGRINAAASIEAAVTGSRPMTSPYGPL